jgi:hypothetical protein
MRLEIKKLREYFRLKAQNLANNGQKKIFNIKLPIL